MTNTPQISAVYNHRGFFLTNTTCPLLAGPSDLHFPFPKIRADASEWSTAGHAGREENENCAQIFKLLSAHISLSKTSQMASSDFKWAEKYNPTTCLGGEKEKLVHSASANSTSYIPSRAPRKQLKLRISKRELPLPLLPTPSLPMSANDTFIHQLIKELKSHPDSALSHHSPQIHHTVLLIQHP